jgi:hypothetical protein
MLRDKLIKIGGRDGQGFAVSRLNEREKLSNVSQISAGLNIWLKFGTLIKAEVSVRLPILS